MRYQQVGEIKEERTYLYSKYGKHNEENSCYQNSVSNRLQRVQQSLNDQL